uniref:Uncharacterized protein n=1 Tax=Globodera rostochiensis TaxID=31243 RepID=A0A914I6L1_GLORO
MLVLLFVVAFFMGTLVVEQSQAQYGMYGYPYSYYGMMGYPYYSMYGGISAAIVGAKTRTNRMKLVFVLSICVLFGVMFGLGEAHYYGGYGSYWPSMYGSYGYGYGGGWGGWPYYGYGYYGKRSVGFEPGEEKSKRN